MDRRVIPEIDVAADQPFRTCEQDLWISVILTAVDDAFFASDWSLRATEGKGGDTNFDAEIVRGDARRFLTMKWGPWSESRERVCAAARVDSELLAQACRKKLELARAHDEKRETEAHAKRVARVAALFENLLARSDKLHPGRLEQHLNRIAEIELETA